jgi:hypothetical protein
MAGTGGTGGSTGQVFPCTEQGIRDAIALGGGTHTFACDGPTTVVTRAEVAIDNDVILDGEGNLTVDGDEHHRVFSVAEGITAELRGFTATKGFSSYGGGGIFNWGTLTLTNSTLSGNSAAGGGGIYNSGTLTLTHSTLSGNSAAGGGGIWNDGTLTLTNSTVSVNTAEGGYGGGGIFNYVGTLTLTHSTVSDNSGGGIHNYQGTVALTNTLVDNDCAGGTTSGGGNLESPGDTCGFDQSSDQVNVTAEQLALGPLQNNGGPTMTHALPPESVAVDAIPQEDCLDAEGNPLMNDQRGEPRPAGPNPDRCDAGSFELVCFGSGCTSLCVDAAIRCDDLNPCTDDVCDPFTGTCSNANDDDNSCDTCSGVNGGCLCRAGACVDCTLPEPVNGQVVRNACRNSFNQVVSVFSVIMDVALNQCALEHELFSADVTVALVLDTTFLQLAADVLCDLGIPLTEATVLGAQVQIDSVAGAECGPELSVLSPVPQDVALDVTVTGVCGAGGSVLVNSGVTLPLDPVTLSCTAGAVGETVAICSVGLTPLYQSPDFPRSLTWMKVSVPGIPEVAFGCGGPATTNPAPGEEVGCDVLNSEFPFLGTRCISVVGAGTFGETPFPTSECQLTAPPTEPIICGDVECPGTCETVPIGLDWSECATFPVDR